MLAGPLALLAGTTVCFEHISGTYDKYQFQRFAVIVTILILCMYVLPSCTIGRRIRLLISQDPQMSIFQRLAFAKIST